ncbi:C39 family peptidase [Enterococcus sp. AZ196]|uniref:C39 family peptidase n=1 Tax=Enterococcus sp. AZ196 TaxID=2774659 RepID=UPI003D2E77A4
MKKKNWSLITLTMLMLSIGAGSVTQAEEQTSSSAATAETSSSITARVTPVEETSSSEETAKPVDEAEVEQEASADETDLTRAKRATPDQETPAPDPETAEVQAAEAASAPLAAEVYANNGLKPIYRVYNPNSGEHLHTLNAGEKDSLMSIGWVYEGISMQIDGSGSNLYRAYNPNSGEHFYTKDYNEINKIKRAGWRYEGVAWKVPNSGKKVYRLFNPNARDAGSHHYTLLESEKNSLVKIGWRYEGVSWSVTGGSVTAKSTNLIKSVPYVSQYTPVKAPWGCASASLAMILGSKNIKPSLKTMQDKLPMYPANPNGQKGNVYTGAGFGWVIKPNALAAYGKTYGGNTVDISGSNTVQIINRVLNGQPVLYYGYSSYQNNADKNRNHCKVIAGYNGGKFLVYDPLYYSANAGPGSGGKNMLYDHGAKAWITMGQYNAEKDGRAITIQ